MPRTTPTTPNRPMTPAARRGVEREHPVAGEKDGRAAVAMAQDRLRDVVPLVVGVGSTGDLSPELVGDRGQRAGDGLPGGRPGGREARVRVDDSAEARVPSVEE